MLYVNPLGEYIELDNYSNKINKLKKNNLLNNAKIKNINKINTSTRMNLIFYSIIAAIFILMTIVVVTQIISQRSN